ncbi:bifunctional folylpolyglutamate synthase/dihydrofolate synthase [Streptococcus minor]|uniref:tetrahydrofolate synthase n=1 Tax=Streptococcus minor TaxID=229549 RepID=A0A3P1VFM5_9STRE|nr:folylpolyglutamate synthase/dihydrofolate synthase family protein [Streptococcus minor]RRD32456.1 bifunctional folylpolyglutamate synthase/dihydrofolate synthase [Streptococcus minor]
MDYQESLDWIHSKLKFGTKPGIERVKWLLNELGNPQEKVKGVHVIGTNGKGSTVNYLQHIFTAAGYEVGTFTSPFIMDFRERISLNGQMISKEELTEMVNRIEPIVERLPKETPWEAATEFEIITVLMFLYFGEVHPVDIAFIEAGMGGLHDSTNVFQPLVIVCPSIGLDHQAYLGEDHAAIARNKTGVMKAGVPVVYATERQDVVGVFEERANMLTSKTYLLERDFSYQERGEKFDFIYQDERVDSIQLAMPGQHQKANASLAIMTTLLLKESYPNISKTKILSALSTSRWLGRTEFIRHNLMIDGAHNNESVQVLVDLLKSSYSDKDIHILFAAIEGKPVTDMLRMLEEFASLTVTSFDFPKALPLEAYPSKYIQVPSWQEWVTQMEPDEQRLYIVTGSLYFISNIRQALVEKDK